VHAGDLLEKYDPNASNSRTALSDTEVNRYQRRFWALSVMWAGCGWFCLVEQSMTSYYCSVVTPGLAGTDMELY